MEKWRSKEMWKSLEAAGGRTTFKTVGLTDEDFKRPFIGIANTWAEMGPGHMHLRQIAEVVKAGVWQQAESLWNSETWRNVPIKWKGHTASGMIQPPGK